MENLWATARYDLGLSTSDFYALTPRQFHLLAEAHRKRLAHQEMIQAYTTAAIINYSLAAPDDPAQPIQFMPHYKKPAPDEAVPANPITEDELTDWQTRVANLAAELKAGGGPMLEEIKAKANG
jgi:hypothetical protein